MTLYLAPPSTITRLGQALEGRGTDRGTAMMTAPVTLTTDYCGLTCRLLCLVFGQLIDGKWGEFEITDVMEVRLVHATGQVSFSPYDQRGAEFPWLLIARSALHAEENKQLVCDALTTADSEAKGDPL